jgi:hypothetical protein
MFRTLVAAGVEGKREKGPFSAPFPADVLPAWLFDHLACVDMKRGPHHRELFTKTVENPVNPG